MCLHIFLTPVTYSTSNGMSVVWRASTWVHALRRTVPMPFSKESKLSSTFFHRRSSQRRDIDKKELNIAIGDIPKSNFRQTGGRLSCELFGATIQYFTNRFFFTNRARGKVLKPNGTTVTFVLGRAHVCVCEVKRYQKNEIC